jgi:4-amino-4-deoxy-L-arabinose transferase-like glycosyltransferase
LAIGLLAKGPVALILIGLPIGGWTLLRWQWREVWCGLPWIFGLLLTATLALPWYCLAEMRTPGFLEYFIIGEHWKRFLVPGWSGDLYGNAHLRPRGMIWFFWLVCGLPWSISLFLVFSRKIYQNILFFKSYRPDSVTVYFVLWAVAPMVFFMFSRNILPAYVLPGIPAFAILLARSTVFQVEKWAFPATRSLMWPSAAMLVVFIITIVLVSLGYGVSEKSQKNLVTAFEQNRKDKTSQLVYLFKRPLSARFYSAGQARFASNIGEAKKFLQNKVTDYFVVPEKKLLLIPSEFLDQVSYLGAVSGSYLMVEKLNNQIN